MVGALFAAVHVPAMAFVVIAMLFVVIRPMSVLLALAGTRTGSAQRMLASWFGIRGVGTMYYAMYAINAGLPRPAAEELLAITTAVVVASIFLHGISVTPLMSHYVRRRTRVAGST
jgi:NhaP-type Na+/H+ or K+/H+ antiporter